MFYLLSDFGLLEFSPGFRLISLFGEFSGQDSENEIEDEEGSDDDESDEVDPRPRRPNRVVHVVHRVGPTLHRHAHEHRQHGQTEVVEVGDSCECGSGSRGG